MYYYAIFITLVLLSRLSHSDDLHVYIKLLMLLVFVCHRGASINNFFAILHPVVTIFGLTHLYARI